MATLNYARLSILAVTLFFAACAISPEEESRRQVMEADIEAILAHPIDTAVLGETKRCLGDNEYRGYRVLGDRRMLFDGRGDKLWINTLRSNCPDLRRGGTLVIRSLTGRRICEADNFEVAEWFERPWFRRWPWGGRSGTGMSCTFGEFQPVTREQVAEIEEVLDSQR